MKNFIIAFVVFLLWSFFGLWIYSWLQSDKDLSISDSIIAENITDSVPTKELGEEIIPIEDSISSSISKKDTLQNNDMFVDEKQKGLEAINIQGDVIFLFSEGISITKNSSEISIPQSIIDFKYKISTYLIEHPKQEVHIVSLYSPLENIEPTNLGYQRGAKLKKTLIDTGIPSEKIVIKSMIKDISFNNEETYNNSFSFYFRPLDLSRIEMAENKIPEITTVYPKFSSSGILVNEALEKLLNEIVTFANNNPNIKIEVIGHTDNIGSDRDNYLTGLRYARQVRWYLISKGNIDKKQVIASSRGESEPIADNNKQQGRILNRRIEVIYY